MTYLEAEYTLNPVSIEVFQDQAAKAQLLMSNGSLDSVLKELMAQETQGLARNIQIAGNVLLNSYGEGGGYFCLTAGVGIAALRAVNPIDSVPAIEPIDWQHMVEREQRLQRRPKVTTIEELAESGLLEIADVNDGYVEGYRVVHRHPETALFRGFTGLAALDAHDLMHFASTRQ